MAKLLIHKTETIIIQFTAVWHSLFVSKGTSDVEPRLIAAFEVMNTIIYM